MEFDERPDLRLGRSGILPIFLPFLALPRIELDKTEVEAYAGAVDEEFCPVACRPLLLTLLSDLIEVVADSFGAAIYYSFAFPLFRVCGIYGAMTSSFTLI